MSVLLSGYIFGRWYKKIIVARYSEHFSVFTLLLRLFYHVSQCDSGLKWYIHGYTSYIPKKIYEMTIALLKHFFNHIYWIYSNWIEPIQYDKGLTLNWTNTIKV